MLCAELMKIDIRVVSPLDAVEEAARAMRDRNVGFLPVCDESKVVMGTITDRDIAIRLVAEGLPSETLVEEIMSPEVVACSPRDDVLHAQKLMAENQKARILCVDDAGRLVGLISLSDVAQRDYDGRAAETLRQVSGREAR
jgi:CBS domain-containing protein